MKNITTRLIILLILATTMAGCINDAGGRVIDEGVITYKMNYPKDNPRNQKSSLVGLLPQEIKMYFKDNNTSMVINGFFFSLKYVTDYHSGKIHTIFKALTNSLVCSKDSSELAYGYSEMGNMDITLCQDTCTIGGYLCNKAVAKSRNIDMTVDVWYTQNIKIASANTGNPFRNLDGVPMKFSIVLCGFFMEIEASHVEAQNKNKTLVTDDVFLVPEDYDKISEEGLTNVFESLTRNK